METPRIMASVLKWPPFIFAIFLLYWSVAINAILYRVKWLKFTGKRNDVVALAKGLKNIHMVTVKKVGTRELYREKPAMFLMNHRCFADFMLDQYVTEGRGLFLSRMAVPIAFPFVMMAYNFIRCNIIFRRDRIGDIDTFNRSIDQQFAASPQTGLAVYPEGHRSTKGESLPLKRGMLKYAYLRRIPVQIVISVNKEAAISEKRRTARFRQTVATGFSEVLLPSESPDFEAFMSKVQSAWDSEWNEVFTTDDIETLPVLPDVEPQFDYPMDVRLIMLACVLINIMCFVVTGVLWWKGVRAVMGLLGPLQWPVAAAVALYVIASFYVYSQPVSASEVHAKGVRERITRPAVPVEVVAAGAETAAGNGKKMQ